MTGKCRDALRQFLFEHKGCELVNLKLLRGDASDVSEEELCEQIHSALFQVETGAAETHETFPEQSKRKFDLHKLEANL